MITYNKIITEYFKANDTDLKRLVNTKFEESKITNFIHYTNEFFYKLGLTSVIIRPAEMACEWDAQYDLSSDNIFSEKTESILLNEEPVYQGAAEEILAKEVIKLISTADINEVNNRIR